MLVFETKHSGGALGANALTKVAGDLKLELERWALRVENRVANS